MIDWNEYLPPKDLPDSGPKDWRPGQVWAFTVGVFSCIIIMPQSDNDRAVRLAGSWPQLSTIGWANYWLDTGILIQDVGQSEPTDPDLLYQFLYR